MTGGFAPAPFRFGASNHSAEEAILQALNDGDGTSLTKDVDSYNYAENLAVARALAEVWSANRRLAFLWDPSRMTDSLPRWEKIFQLPPGATDTEADRRSLMSAKFGLIGKPASLQVVRDLMVEILGDVFVSMVNSDSSTATGSCSGGGSAPGGVTLLDGPFSSSIMYVAVKVSQPATMGDQEFYTTVGRIQKFLDPLLPAWCDFGWFRNGTSGAGFFLDDTLNLDNESFDI